MTLTELMSGNTRARASGKAAASKAPRHLSVAILTCTDERVLPEAIFDAPRGKFYAVRIAGNVYTPEVAGSLEVAVGRHGCPTILVLGHTGCSAVGLAHTRARVEGQAYDITRRIRHAIEHLPADATPLQSIETNVVHTVRELRERSRLLREFESAGKLTIVGGIFDLDTGAVRILPT